ncbi:MAG TPA: tetratricopeptide repeat protein [Bryobacteraceae bacterium]|nr:tetratricopeptide repeat protein [Bryobacteraceae bacterium]
MTYSEVKRHARQITSVTRSRYMPPWLPAEGYGHFANERRLSDTQIQTIAAWVAAGEPEGLSKDLPAAPILKSGWRLGTPDLIVTAGSPHAVPASGPDVFWNFTFRPKLAKTRYVSAMEIKPAGSDANDAARIIHHANVSIDRSGSIRRLEPKPGSGFPGMELALDRNPFDPESHFLFWKPGSQPEREPPDMAWRLDPGNALVLNTHLQTTGKQETIQPLVGLYFTDRPPSRFPLLLELEHDNALEIPANDPNFLISDDFRLPMDVDVLAVYPHAHYLGRLLEAYATLPDGSRVWLIRIPDWNFAWQAVYRYSQPVFLPKGSVISMRFHYDNSSANPRNPNTPPKLVEAGNRATDEMGHLWLQVLPLGHGDRRRELQEAVVRHRLDKVPDDFQAHINLGALMMSRLQTQSAIDQFQTAIRLNDHQAEAHDMLGSALRSVGRSQEAIAQYKRALQLDPTYVDARYDLATSLARSGQFPEAIAELRHVLQAFPSSARLHNELGEMLAQTGDLHGALAQFTQAVALDPADTYAVKNRDWAVQHLAQAHANH